MTYNVGTQAMPHTVRVVGGKQRGHRSAVRDLSRDEAVTDASKWGLLKVSQHILHGSNILICAEGPAHLAWTQTF